MVKYFIKLDYALAVWFSKTKERVVIGTAFLFLNKVSFLWFILIYSFSRLTFFVQETRMTVCLAVLGAVIIMYGFKKPIERIVSEGSYKKEFKELSAKQVSKRKILGLFYLIFSFVLMFVLVIFISRI